MTVELISFTENGGGWPPRWRPAWSGAGTAPPVPGRASGRRSGPPPPSAAREAPDLCGGSRDRGPVGGPHLVSKARDPAVVVVDELGAVRCPHPLRPPGAPTTWPGRSPGCWAGRRSSLPLPMRGGSFPLTSGPAAWAAPSPTRRRSAPWPPRCWRGDSGLLVPVAGGRGVPLGSGPGGAGGGPGPAHHPGHAGAHPEAGAQDRLGRDRVPAGRPGGTAGGGPPLRAGGGGAPSSRAGGVCTIDRKGEEPGLLELCRRRRLPLLTYSPEELSRAEGVYPLPFVRQVTGTDNGCERAAVLASGGPLLLKKRQRGRG